MSNLIDRIVEQFKSKTQYDKFIRDIEQKFDIKSYRFQLMTQFMARKIYNQLQQKYVCNQLTINSRIWYQNQRKLFVWSILCLSKLLSQESKELVKTQIKLQQQLHWQQLSKCFFNKQILFLKYQYNAIKKRQKRNPWSQQQDLIVMKCQQNIQNNNWNQIAKQIFFKTNGKCFKCPKQIRQRWQNHLDKNIKKQAYIPQQDLIIFKYVLNQGKKWAQIVEQLKNTRTQHMIKNRYKSLISKYQSNHTQKEYNVNEISLNHNQTQLNHTLINNHNKTPTLTQQQIVKQIIINIQNKIQIYPKYQSQKQLNKYENILKYNHKYKSQKQISENSSEYKSQSSSKYQHKYKNKQKHIKKQKWYHKINNKQQQSFKYKQQQNVKYNQQKSLWYNQQQQVKYDNCQQNKDKIQQQLPEIRLNNKSSFYGFIERDSNGQFTGQKITFPSPVPFIFENRSPACISFSSSFLANSHSLFNSRDLTPTTNQTTTNFQIQTQKWNKFLAKKPYKSTYQQGQTNVTQQLFGIKSDSFLRLSHEYNDISQGSLKSTYLFSPTIQTLQNQSNNNQQISKQLFSKFDFCFQKAKQQQQQK